MSCLDYSFVALLVVVSFTTFSFLGKQSSLSDLPARASSAIVAILYHRPSSPFPPHTLLLSPSGDVTVDTTSPLSTPSNLSAILRSRRNFLFITPRDDGFNNQRITIAEALYCASQSGAVAVLPLIFANTRYGTKVEGPYLFRDYFDLSALATSRVANFTTPDVLYAAHLDSCRIDALPGGPTRVIDALTAIYNWPRAGVPHARDRKRSMSSLPSQCRASSRCQIKYGSPQVFGTTKDYERWGQGYSLEASPAFRRVRAALRPSSTVLAIAATLVGAMDGPYNAVHLRRSDYKKKCLSMRAECRKFGEYSMYVPSSAVVQKVRELPNPSLPLFVATEDKRWAQKMLRPKLAAENVTVFLAQEVQLPPDLEDYVGRIDMLSFATQVAASKAECFIGNRFSSFSSEIFNERILRGVDTRKRFF